MSALAAPSPLLERALGPRTSVFLSDVETDAWRNGTVADLAARVDPKAGLAELARVREQLNRLQDRLAWVSGDAARRHLSGQIKELRGKIG